MRVHKVMEGRRRGSACDAQRTMASATFADNFFFASLTQVVPIGAVKAYNLMLHGNVLCKQGQRRSRMVAGCVFFHSNLRCPLTILTTSMPLAISTGYSVPFDPLLWTDQWCLLQLLSRPAENVCE